MVKSIVYKVFAAFIAEITIIVSFNLTIATKYIDCYSDPFFNYTSCEFESITLSDLFFGNQKPGISGGISYFALITLLLIVAGFVFLVVDIFTSKAKLGFLGSILLILGGIAIFLTLSCGTDLSIQVSNKITNTYTFKAFYSEYDFDIGAYLWMILCIAGGIFGFVGTKEAIFSF